MTQWILIVVWYSSVNTHSPEAMNIKFATKGACLTASEQLEAAYPRLNFCTAESTMKVPVKVVDSAAVLTNIKEK